MREGLFRVIDVDVDATIDWPPLEVRTYPPIYLPTYLTCLPTYLLIYLPTYLPTNLPTYVPTYLRHDGLATAGGEPGLVI